MKNQADSMRKVRMLDFGAKELREMKKQRESFDPNSN
jgi:hypothetical protein